MIIKGETGRPGWLGLSDSGLQIGLVADKVQIHGLNHRIGGLKGAGNLNKYHQIEVSIG
jgi:hypothetical protein